LRFNVKDVNDVIARNERDLNEIQRVRAELLKGIRDKVPDAELMAHFESDWKAGLTLGIKVPTLRHEAWDAAVANQAVTWMPDAQLQRYVTAYADMRDVQTLTTGGGANFIDAPRMMDTLSDLDTGTATPHQMLRTLSQLRSAYGSVDGNLRNLLKSLPKGGDVLADAH
jgi:hypothetical protein